MGDVEDAISGELWAKHMYAKQVPPLTMDAVAQDIVRLAMEREIVKGPVVISNGAYAGVRLVEMGLKLLRARTALCEAINQKYRITMYPSEFISLETIGDLANQVIQHVEGKELCSQA